MNFTPAVKNFLIFANKSGMGQAATGMLLLGPWIAEIQVKPFELVRCKHGLNLFNVKTSQPQIGQIPAKGFSGQLRLLASAANELVIHIYAYVVNVRVQGAQLADKLAFTHS